MDVSSKYCNLAYSNQSVLLGSELVFLIPMVGSAIARYRVESNGATYCTLGGSSGSNEWRRTHVHFGGCFWHSSKLTIVC